LHFLANRRSHGEPARQFPDASPRFARRIAEDRENRPKTLAENSLVGPSVDQADYRGRFFFLGSAAGGVFDDPNQPDETRDGDD
jgi:hypothetical protein